MPRPARDSVDREIQSPPPPPPPPAIARGRTRRARYKKNRVKRIPVFLRLGSLWDAHNAMSKSIHVGPDFDL
jgi:hypothetical protein